MVDVFFEAALNFFSYPIQECLNDLNSRSTQSTHVVVTIDVKLVVLMTELHSVSPKYLSISEIFNVCICLQKELLDCAEGRGKKLWT